MDGDRFDFGGDGGLASGEDRPRLVPAGGAGGERAEDAAPGLRLVVVNVGNTNASLSVSVGSRLEKPRRLSADDAAGVAAAVGELIEAEGSGDGDAGVRGVVIGSVNERASGAIAAEVRGRSGVPVYALGRDIGLAMTHRLSESAIAGTGQDRLLNAMAAFDAARQAVVVVDAGTAITVDFVDGEGAFCGGAIAPGARAQLRAMSSSASVLPGLEMRLPDDEPFGRDTEQAMLQGVVYGAQGLVRRLVERYAMAYDAYPMVVATGGDAGLLFEGDELVDRVVPHLTLRGIAVACQRALAASGDAGGLDWA